MTNKELAGKIGVSEATISLVLNGKAGISEKTRKKVIDEIIKLGYGELVSDKAINVIEDNNNYLISINNIGFILYTVSGQLLGMNSFFPLIFQGIESTARKYGYNLIVITVDRREREEGVARIKESGCKGFIIFATEMQDSDLLYFEKADIPFVLFDNYFPDSEINSVKVNNEQGIYKAIKYLHDLGHRRIGYLSSGLQINSFIERKMWTGRVLEMLGLSFNEKYCFTIGYPTEVAEANMREILQRKPELPTAFVADNDLVAIGAMLAFKKEGYNIPRDVSIVGYDDRPICELVDPALTTIRLPRDVFGAAAVDRLCELIKYGNKCTLKVEINGQLIIRDSTNKRL